MKLKLFILFSVLFFFSESFAQVFESNSARVNIQIKYAPKDSLLPSLSIILPVVPDTLPVYQKEKEIVITGKAQDNSGQVFVTANGKNPDSFINDKFQIKLPLNPGENKIVVKARDKSNNTVSKTFVVIQDPNADVTPPVVTVLEPTLTRGIIVVRDTSKSGFRVKWQIKDDSKLTGVWINNIKMQIPENGEFTYEFPKAPDTVLITAVDKYHNTAKKYLELKKDVVSSTVAGNLFKGKFYALIIACEEYHDLKFPDLDFPVKDGKNLAGVLEKDYTFSPENIFMLQNPTRSKIIQKFNELKKKITPEDNLIVFYAGHGQWDEDLKQGFWLPTDASSSDPSEWLSNSTVKEFIRGIKSKHTLLIADACFAGGIFKSRDMVTEAPASIVETYKYVSRRAITSGALKTVPDKSVFVEYLIKRLEDNQEKYLTTQQLYVSFKDAVTNNSPNNQTPMYGILQEADDEGIGDFIFIHK